MKTKDCIHCFEELELTKEFYSINRTAKDGFNNVCKSCDNKRRNRQRSKKLDFSESWDDNDERICPLVLPIKLDTKRSMSQANEYGEIGTLTVYACMTWGPGRDEEGKRYPTQRHSVWVTEQDALAAQERLNNG